MKSMPCLLGIFKTLKIKNTNKKKIIKNLKNYIVCKAALW